MPRVRVAGGASIAYEAAGPWDGPAVLFVHGGAMSRDDGAAAVRAHPDVR